MQLFLECWKKLFIFFYEGYVLFNHSQNEFDLHKFSWNEALLKLNFQIVLTIANMWIVIAFSGKNKT